MRPARVAPLVRAALFSSAVPALLSGGSQGASVPAARVVVNAPARVAASAPAAPGCADCHVEIAREWRASLHRQAWTDTVFQRSYAQEPRQFCRSCHVPLASPGLTPEPEAAREGIDCTVCHGAMSEVRSSAHGRSDTPAGMTGHPVLRDASMERAGACASCHQFAFPADYGVPVHGESGLMQHTVDEWSRSRAASEGTQCQGCHMPTVNGPDGRPHRSHLFPGAGDEALLRQALSASVSAVRSGNDAVLSVRLRAGVVGHSVPTGDLFREVRWAVQRAGDDEFAGEYTLARRFRRVRGTSALGRHVSLRRDGVDLRLGAPAAHAPSERRFTVRVRAARGTPLEWTLTHLRMGPGLAHQLGVNPAANERVFLRGALLAP